MQKIQEDSFMDQLARFCEERGYKLSNYTYSVYNQNQPIYSADTFSPLYVLGKQ